MAARRPSRPPPEPISAGDIVTYGDHTWEVAGVVTLGDASPHPQTQLRLERREQVKTRTPYGRPQRYKTTTVGTLADAGRCRLVAHQEALF